MLNSIQAQANLFANNATLKLNLVAYSKSVKWKLQIHLGLLLLMGHCFLIWCSQNALARSHSGTYDIINVAYS